MAADIRNTIALLFIGVLIVGIFAFIGLYFINSVNNARIVSARAEWRTEALMLANRLVSDPNCFGYTRLLIYYNESSGDLETHIVKPPMTVDFNKLIINDELNIDRASDCIKLDSPEFKLLIGLSFLYNTGSDSKRWGTVYNINPLKYYNNDTVQVVSLPVRVINDGEVNYGTLIITLSVNSEYLGVKLL